MKSQISAAVAGVVFGVGLGLSGMTEPAKVIGFLDVFGAWNASLVFVMGGGVVVHFVLSRFILRRDKPWFEVRFHLPTQAPIDAKLVAGAAIFGVGWGLAGYCPGPAIVSLGSGALAPIAFVAAMALGMAMQHWMSAPRAVTMEEEGGTEGVSRA